MWELLGRVVSYMCVQLVALVLGGDSSWMNIASSVSTLTLGTGIRQLGLHRGNFGGTGCHCLCATVVIPACCRYESIPPPVPEDNSTRSKTVQEA